MTNMTKTELLNLVTRYTEACDDLGAGLFEQTAEQTATKHKVAGDLWAQIGAEVERLHADAIKSERRAITFGDIVHQQVIAMRAAVVDAKLRGSDAGMEWIENTLCGPGHLPDIQAAKAEGGAQAMFDREMAAHEAFRAAHPAP
jgi:hypothetical protein